VYGHFVEDFASSESSRPRINNAKAAVTGKQELANATGS
jgi:hypothetical protein